ncbi:UPF0182 family protein [Streptomyces sp. SL13]|uniref:UPF0182 protein POF50_013750 n=2 Tax=Streptantibioticus silvisoli TaxID=2705255 RepID=A0AA90K950_9ACTN|nr:UPF0182 family protein [Streptantibioticus silvisoli]MDI5970392.1 UPF0182 family protein [Streptantibioticus silvisoli]
MAFPMPEREDGQDGRDDDAETYSARLSTRQRALFAVVAAVALLSMGFVAFSGFWTDHLWYRSVGYGSVFHTALWTRVGLFAVFGGVMAAAVGANAYLAHRMRPPVGAMSPEEQGIDRYRMGIAPFRVWLVVVVSALVGLIAGASAAGQWRVWLAYANAVPFGTRDPQFGLDASFYTFDLPWYRFVLSFGFAVVVLSLVSAALTHYLYGGLRVTSPGARATAAATGHLSVLLGLFVSLKAAAYWLDRYGLAVKSSGFRTTAGWTGLRYVDANAYLPAKTILFCIAVICALLFFATLWRRTWSLPVLAFGLMVLSAVLIGGLYPAIVQKFQVQPDQAVKEAPYLRRNITATRAAYGLTGVRVSPLPAAPKTSGAKLRADADSTADVTLLDPDVAAPDFRQAQQAGGYYTFTSPLTVDRYPVDGREQPTVLGLRELKLSGVPDDNWTNEHFTYTHGYGVVAADADSTTDAGAPLLTERDVPPTGALGSYEPRIYYGQDTTQYSIVGGGAKEVDYADGGGEKSTRYAGVGGVSLADTFTRAAYAVQTGDPQILYSAAIGPASRILYDRTPQQRVQAVAPWLTVDGTPYPAVVDGRIQWIVDGYTTSDDYPYSSRTTLGTGGAGRQVNYARDAVKATVDAYDGTVRLYQWDTRDPVLKTWMRAFPHTVLPKKDIPPALTAHLRYPQDLFTTQRALLTRYHVTDAAAFASGSEEWRVPADPTGAGSAAEAPQYQSITLPGDTSRTWQLTSGFTSTGRQNVSAFLAVDSDATSAAYGTMRLLELPTGDAVPGPRATQTDFTADPAVAGRLAELRKGGSRVEFGDQQAIPMDGGVLYVEPVYTAGPGAGPPALKLVLASYGTGRPAFGSTLDQALDGLFGSTSAPEPPPAASGAAADATAVRRALADAQRDFDAGQKAMRSGDWTAYGKAQQALNDALRRASDAEKRQAAATGDR